MGDEAYALIEKAALFVDEGADQTKWLPSELLKIGYSIAATSNKPEKAQAWLDLMLRKARRRWLDGYCANPFPNTPMPRNT